MSEDFGCLIRPFPSSKRFKVRPPHLATLSPPSSFPAMGQFFEEIPPFLISWLEKQQMFWTATAPLSGMGHVNLSPKCTRGMFHIVHSQKVWYEDMSGSGLYPENTLWTVHKSDVRIIRCRDNISFERAWKWTNYNSLPCFRGSSQNLQAFWYRLASDRTILWISFLNFST